MFLRERFRTPCEFFVAYLLFSSVRLCFRHSAAALQIMAVCKAGSKGGCTRRIPGMYRWDRLPTTSTRRTSNNPGRSDPIRINLHFPLTEFKIISPQLGRRFGFQVTLRASGAYARALGIPVAPIQPTRSLRSCESTCSQRSFLCNAAGAALAFPG